MSDPRHATSLGSRQVPDEVQYLRNGYKDTTIALFNDVCLAHARNEDNKIRDVFISHLAQLLLNPRDQTKRMEKDTCEQKVKV